MRFGAFVPQGWRLDLPDVPVEKQWDLMVASAAVAEETGFDSVWVYDHLHTFPDVTQQSTWEAFTVMAGLAEATTRVRLGQMCTCNSYRPPSYLAKVSSCIDVMSGGRFDLGIGAGWYEGEYDAYGYDFPKPSVRIGMLDEAVQIITAMWTQDEATFHGKHYRIDGAINRPKPLQDPHPPFWIAGGGEQLTLKTVAKYGQYSNFGGDAETFARKRSILEKHCADVGRDFDEITLSRNIDCVVGETEADAARKLDEWAAKSGRDASAWKKNKGLSAALYGTPESVMEQIAAHAAAGVEYLIVYFNDASFGDGMRIFGETVIPALTGR